MPGTASKQTTTPPADEGARDDAYAKDGAHLERRQKRNTALTEQSQRDARGAHTGKPDPTNP